MPRRPQKPCRFSGCNTLTRNANGYCDSHSEHAIGWKRTQQKKGNTTDRGYGWAWQKIRKRILQRDAYLCQPCLEIGIVKAATDVDHIINKESGGSDSENNLQSICKECHKLKTAAESRI